MIQLTVYGHFWVEGPAFSPQRVYPPFWGVTCASPQPCVGTLRFGGVRPGLRGLQGFPHLTAPLRLLVARLLSHLGLFLHSLALESVFSCSSGLRLNSGLCSFCSGQEGW